MELFLNQAHVVTLHSLFVCGVHLLAFDQALGLGIRCNQGWQLCPNTYSSKNLLENGFDNDFKFLRLRLRDCGSPRRKKAKISVIK
jgi:hypothetical protein